MIKDVKIQVEFQTDKIDGTTTNRKIYLDLYEYEIPKLTISIEDITSTDLKTPYSNTFRVPNSNNNAQFFKSVFDINGLDFDVSKRVDCTIIVGDDIYTYGELRLNKIYNYELEGRTDYECVFIGQLRNLASKLGDKNLNDLDWTGWISTDYCVDNYIEESWNAYPQTEDGGLILGDGEAGDVIFPLVDFGNTIDSDGEILVGETSLSVFTSNPPYVGMPQFKNSGASELNINYLRPMVRVKAVLDKILSEAGFKYDSAFLNSQDFKNLYISAWGNDDKAFIERLGNNLSIQITDELNETGGLVVFRDIANVEFYTDDDFAIDNVSYHTFYPLIRSDVNGEPLTQLTQLADLELLYEDSDLSLKGSNNYYLVPEDNTYTIFANIWTYYEVNQFLAAVASFVGGISLVYTKENLSGTTVLYEQVYDLDDLDYVGFGVGLYPTKLASNQMLAQEEFDLEEGDKIRVEFRYDLNTTLSNTSTIANVRLGFCAVNISTTDSYNDICPTFNLQDNNFFENDYKQIDLIKDITNKFRLVIDEDKSEPNKLKIEPFEYYVAKSQEVLNWTEYLDLSKSQELKPIFSSQKRKIEFVDKMDTDMYSKLYQDNFNDIWGKLEIEEVNELLIGSRKIESPKLYSTPSTQVRGFLDNGNWNNFLFPVIAKENKDGLTEPIRPKTRFLYYNGLVDIDDQSNPWYIGGGMGAQYNFPMVSQWSSYPLSSNTLWLNWSKEFPFNRSTDSTYINMFQQGLTVYDRYWSSYIQYLYDKNSRIYTAYFKLSYLDLREFNFSKVIQVKSNYYYVNKIENLPLTGTNVVKVELIKLNNFSPIYTPITPTEYNIWNTDTDIWDTTTDTWND